MNRWSEKTLVKRILAGDREACARLVRLDHAPIYRLLVRLCGDRHLAEDLTQETFAAGWSRMAAFSGASSLSTWLHRIAYRKLVDARRRARSRASVWEKAVEQLRSSRLDASDEAIASEEARRLRQALDRLPPSERDIIVLHYLQGLSFREMAKVLDQSTGTVKWRTTQALESLRALLGGSHERTGAGPAEAVEPQSPAKSVTPASGAAGP